MPKEVCSAIAVDLAYLEGWIRAFLDISELEEFLLNKGRAEAMFSSLPLRTKVEGQLSLAVDYLQLPHWRVLRRSRILKQIRILAPKNQSAGSGRANYHEQMLHFRATFAECTDAATKDIQHQGHEVQNQPQRSTATKSCRRPQITKHTD